MELKPFSLLGHPQPVLVHVHTPRTGGTTFREILLERYDDVAVLQEPERIGAKMPKEIIIRDKDHPYWTNRKRFLRNWRRRAFPKARVYHGHLPLGLYPEAILQGASIVTWLRDPVDLVLSWYRWESCSPMLKASCIEEFIEEKPRQNVMSEMLEGKYTIYFGITEHYQEDLAIFAKAMGWEPFGYYPHFGQPYSPELMGLYQNRKLIQRILKLNERDWCLYRMACEARITNGRLWPE